MNLKELKKKYPNISFYEKKEKKMNILGVVWKISYKTRYGKKTRTAEFGFCVAPFKKNADNYTLIAHRIDDYMDYFIGHKILHYKVYSYTVLPK